MNTYQKEAVGAPKRIVLDLPHTMAASLDALVSIERDRRGHNLGVSRSKLIRKILNEYLEAKAEEFTEEDQKNINEEFRIKNLWKKHNKFMQEAYPVEKYAEPKIYAPEKPSW